MWGVFLSPWISYILEYYKASNIKDNFDCFHVWSCDWFVSVLFCFLMCLVWSFVVCVIISFQLLQKEISQLTHLHDQASEKGNVDEYPFMRCHFELTLLCYHACRQWWINTSIFNISSFHFLPFFFAYFFFFCFMNIEYLISGFSHKSSLLNLSMQAGGSL